MANLSVTNTFVASTAARASEVNANFSDIVSYVNARNAGTTAWDAGSFAAGISITPVSNQLILGTTNTVTISATAPSASRVYTIADAGAAASFVMTEGTQTVNGAKTFGTSPIIDTGSANAALTIQTTDGSAAKNVTVNLKPSGNSSSVAVINVTDTDGTPGTPSPLVVQMAGTTEVMRITSAGIMTRPLQPYFLVHTNLDQTNVTGDGTTYKVQFDDEILDRTNNFASYTFTAPVDGIYHFDVQVGLSSLNGSDHNVQTLALVTTNRTYSTIRSTVASGDDYMRLSVAANMTAGHTAYVNITVAGTVKSVDLGGSSTPVKTFFSGYLVA